MRGLILVILVFCFKYTTAQTDSFEILELDIPQIEIKGLMPTKIPYRVSSSMPINLGTVYKNYQQLNFQEYINATPGLFSLNANNYAQDLRISIRGFGARAAFGIRGIKLIVDGIPETSPDGQGQLDNTDPSIIKNITVLRGPASTYYGNAAGGAILINTTEPIDRSFVSGRLNLGSFKFKQYQLKAGINSKNSDFFFSINNTSTNGYRDQSGFKSTNLNSNYLFKSRKLSFKAILNYTDSPVAEDPGSINLEDLINDRKQARDRNILFQTGESISQFKIGFQLKASNIAKGTSLNSYAFMSTRNFNGKLPFEFGGIIDLKRNYGGIGISLEKRIIKAHSINKMRLGIEVNLQNDERQRFQNLEGSTGNLTLDQDEIFENYAVYFQDHFLYKKWFLEFGIRYDINKIRNKDQFLSNGDDSGDINLDALNPSLGISYKFSNKSNLFANFRTSFETPSLNELSNNPLGNGFNPNLNPQRSLNFELGYKYNRNNKLSYDISLFHIDTKEEFIPFELEEFQGQTFYRNAGSSKRNGIEIGAIYTFKKHWNIQAAYTYSDFKYDDYQIDNNNFSGNQLPGIPKHYGYIGIIKSQETGLNLLLESRLIGNLYTADNNQVEDQAYALVNFQASYEFKINSFSFSPFVGIKNLFNSTYNDNIRINAFGGRYYEAGPGINYYGGLNLKYTFDK